MPASAANCVRVSFVVIRSTACITVSVFGRPLSRMLIHCGGFVLRQTTSSSQQSVLDLISNQIDGLLFHFVDELFPSFLGKLVPLLDVFGAVVKAESLDRIQIALDLTREHLVLGDQLA